MVTEDRLTAIRATLVGAGTTTPRDQRRTAEAGADTAAEPVRALDRS